MSTPALAKETFPLTIYNAAGATVIKRPARRIVVLEYSLLDNLLALGNHPRGTVYDDPAPSHLAPQLETVHKVGGRLQPSLEKIASLNPDLIVGDTYRHQKILPQLKRIAPTVLLSGMAGLYDTQRQNLKTLGQATDKTHHVEKLLAEHDALIAEAKAKLNPDVNPVIIGFIHPNGLFKALTSNSAISSLLEQVGVENSLHSKYGEHNVIMSLENILARQPNTLIVLSASNDSTALDKWRQDPLWTKLKAAQAERVYLFDRLIWAQSHGIGSMNLEIRQAMESGLLAGQPQKADDDAHTKP